MLRFGFPTLIVALMLIAIPPAGAASSMPTTAQTIHVVKAGETVWSIASAHGLPVDLLAKTNRVANPDRLRIGDQLTIPPAAAPAGTATRLGSTALSGEKTHVTSPGDTLWTIARSHGTSVDALVRLNRLPNPDRLQPGQRIVLRTAAAAPAQRRTVPGSGTAAAPGPALRPRWQWPSRGVITSRFGFRGRRHHHGIDIAAPVGTPIYAVQDGSVQFVGRRGGYGLLVILDHGGGLTTWYGHASRILVRAGEEVRRGQTIATVGTTGQVTGPNVHFEVRRNDAPLDPSKFLRSR